MSAGYEEFKYIVNILANGSNENFDEIEEFYEDFPYGKDSYIGRDWLINVIHYGSLDSLKWILLKNTNLNFVNDEGYSPVLTILDSERNDKYIILEILLEKERKLANKQGVNGWSPLHMAAAKDDVKAIEILIKFGADINCRTGIDDNNTPIEEAKSLECKRAEKYLNSK